MAICKLERNIVAILLKDRRAGGVRWFRDHIVSNTDSVPDPAARIMDTAVLPWQSTGAGTQQMAATRDVRTRRRLAPWQPTVILQPLSRIPERILQESQKE